MQWFFWDKFVSLVELVPPILWLTFGTLAIAVAVAAGSSYLIVLFQRRRTVTPPASPVAKPRPTRDVYAAAYDYEPPGRLETGSDFQVLLLCSPVSGSGEGVDLYERVVRRMLRKANIRSEVVFLEKGSQAFETAAELDTHAYSALGIIGGDKVVHEVLQGLSHSCDGEEDALRALLSNLPLAIVPCGARNGLAASLGITDAFEGSKRFVEAVLKGGSGRSVDLYSARRITAPKLPIFDCYLTTWGVAADVSLAVERGWQFIPRSWRLWIACIRALFRMSPKVGVMSLKVQAQSPVEIAGKNLPQPDTKTVTLSGMFTMVAVCNVSRISPGFVIAPDAKPDDGRLHVAVIRHCSRWHALRTVLAASAGEQFSAFPWVQSFVCSEVSILNETGELDICGFGEEELEPSAGPGDGVVIRSLPRMAKVFY